MRVFISVDMEGISGVERLEEVFRGLPGYDTFRQVMAGDVNAAAQGAIDGGATDIVVADSHGYMCNIRPADLHTQARLRSGMQRTLCQYKGFSERFDAVMLVGIHAKSGTPDAIMPHTWIPAFKDVRINDHSVGEGGINSYLAGHFGVPVVVVAGDDNAVAQTRDVLGDGPEYVEVKKTTGPTSAIHLPLRDSHTQIRAAARRAIEQCRRAPLEATSVELPVHLELDLANQADKDPLGTWNDRFADRDLDRALSDLETIVDIQDVSVTGDSTVTWTTDTYLEAYTALFGALMQFYERGIEWLIDEVADPETYDRDLRAFLGDESVNYLSPRTTT